jgi:hypothetical protein
LCLIPNEIRCDRSTAYCDVVCLLCAGLCAHLTVSLDLGVVIETHIAVIGPSDLETLFVHPHAFEG